MLPALAPKFFLQAYANGEIADDTIVYGDAAILEAGQELLNLRVPLHRMANPSDYRDEHLNIVDLQLLDKNDFTPGVLSKKGRSRSTRLCGTRYSRRHRRKCGHRHPAHEQRSHATDRSKNSAGTRN